MKYDIQDYVLISKSEIANGIFDFMVQNDNIIVPKVGQFAHIQVNGKTLRRPISVCDAGQNWIRFVFQVKGEGTEILSKTEVGQTLNILSPCGHGFTIEDGKRYALIGGGIGVPPMLYCAKNTNNPVVITGFRSKDFVILQDDFKNANSELYLVTDDGSAGKRGFVTDVLKEQINNVDAVCACGPTPMLKAIAQICKENSKPCQISLEERMGCGIGACLVCACRTVKDGEEGFSHVCKHGPVFNAEEVVF